jgi:hypothetical protein
MSAERIETTDERVQQALEELKGLLRSRYPEAVFAVAHGEDPEGVYLKVTVDLDDVDEVMDACGDRLLEMQVEEELPVYVIPLQPLERVLRQMQPDDSSHRRAAARGAALNP